MAAVPPVAKAAAPAPAPAPAPVAKVSGPASTNTNLNTFSTGVLGTKFKKGNTWDVAPADWQNKKVGTDTARKIAGKAAGYKDITYTNYDLQTLKADGFPQDSIPTLADKYKIGKTARVYAKTVPELDKMEPEFQKAVDTYRTAKLQPMVAEKKAANQKEWNAMTAGISGKTKAELDGLTQEYLKKKAELEKQLEAAFKAQTKQLVINKQWETKDKYKEYLATSRLAKPGVKAPEGPAKPINLSGALDAAGRPIINSIKVGQTRKRHRFIHLLVTPGTKPSEKDEWYGEGNAPQPFTTSSENDDPWVGVNVPPLSPVRGPKPSNTPPGSPTINSPPESPTAGGGKRKTKRNPRRR